MHVDGARLGLACHWFKSSLLPLIGLALVGFQSPAPASSWQGVSLSAHDDFVVGESCDQIYVVQGMSFLGWNCSTRSLEHLSSVSYDAHLERLANGDLVAFGDSIVRSSDGGASWAAVTTSGISSYYRPRTVAVAPDGALYVNFGSNLYRLPDGASQWDSILQISSGSIGDVGVSPSGAIFALIDAVPRNIMKSTDFGQTWDTVEAPVFDSSLTGIAFDNSGNIFVGSYWDGVFRSQDGGDTWAAKSSGLPIDRGVLDFAVAGGALFALAKDQKTTTGVFRSDDAGDTWSSITENLGTWDMIGFKEIGADAEGSLWVLSEFDGLVQYDLASESWIERPYFPHHVQEIRPTNDGRIVAAASNSGWGPGGYGAWVSADAGATWSRVDPAVDDETATLTAIEVDRDSNVYFATYDRRIFSNPASGDPISSLEIPGGYSPKDVVVDRQGGIYAAAYFEGIHYFPVGSTDAEPFNTGLPLTEFGSVPGFSQMERGDHVLYALANAQDGQFGLFRRGVGEAEWVYLRDSSLIREIGVVNDNTLLSYSYDGSHFTEISSDGGYSWSRVSALEGVAVRDFAVSSDGATVAVAAAEEILASEDFENWNQIAGTGTVLRFV